MQSYYYDNQSSYLPNAQSTSYPGGYWPNGLAAQQYGMDPHVYSDTGAHYQYAGNPYGATTSMAYPTSLPQDLYTDSNPHHSFSHSSYPQQTSWQPTASTHDPYSVQHASLNADPGSAPVYLYPPSHTGSPTAYPGSFAAYPSIPSAYPEDMDDPSGTETSRRTREWSQHLMIQGTPRERIAVACDRCRARKMKCDGAQLACGNCQRAAHRGVVCQYAPEPGRRGADHAQRIRSPPGQRKPRKSGARQEREDTPPESSGYGWSSAQHTARLYS